MVKYNFGSSNGEVVVDQEGNVLEEESALSDYLCDIQKVDLKEMFEWYRKFGVNPEECRGHFDILDVGFWRKDGTYEKADEEHRSIFEEYRNSMIL